MCYWNLNCRPGGFLWTLSIVYSGGTTEAMVQGFGYGEETWWMLGGEIPDGRPGAGGWVPEQLLRTLDRRTRATVTTDYNSIELNVKSDDLVTGTQILAGWVLCKNADCEEGWVPLENLQPSGD